MHRLYELGYSGKTASEEIILGDETAEVRVNPMLSENNEIIGIALYARDITELKNSQEKLIKSERQYKEVVNNVNEVIFQTDNEGNWTFLNQSWERIMGFTVEETLGKLLFNFLHPDDVQRNWDLFEPLIARKKKYCSHVVRYICKNGDVRQIQVYAILITNEKDEIIGTSGTLQDITEQLRNKEMYQILSENVRDMIMIHDTDCKIQYVTPSCLNVVGYETEELIGKDPFVFYHPDDVRGLRQVHFNYTESAEAINNTISYRFLHKNGNYIWLETSSKNIQDLNGKTVSIISSSRNIDERKKLEESLIESLVKEKELNELKSRFVSMASHEFRTPMATIKSSTEILEIRYRELKDQPLKESTDRHLKIINSEIDRLTNLMNDVLLLGKIEANKVTFHPENCSIEKVIQEVIYRQEEKQKDLRKMQFTIMGESRKVMIDPKQFNHILDNLISNAFKYSENANAPELTLCFEEKKFIVEVRDYGIGIPQEERRQIFESFFRAKNADLIQGTGLGLVIVKNFVTLHGGKVNFRDADPVGTIFKVEIPC
jgi:PAS domain S-box-containing protein